VLTTDDVINPTDVDHLLVAAQTDGNVFIFLNDDFTGFADDCRGQRIRQTEIEEPRLSIGAAVRKATSISMYFRINAGIW